MIKVKLKEVMEEKGFNIGTLAEKTGMHRNGISKIIHRKTNGIEYDTLEKLCTVLDCNVCDIIVFEKESD